MKPQELPIKRRLINFAEECSEANQAALKLIRAIEGDTPVTPLQASAHLLEEMADVYVTALALEPDRMTIEAIARQKSKRWEERLSEKSETVRKMMEEGHDDEGE